MRRLLFICLLLSVSYLLTAQVVFKNEGITVNNTITGTWQGINIPRSSVTAAFFINNSVTSVNSAGYLLQAGDEIPHSTNGNLNGAVITGNRFTWNGTDQSSITHGLFTGYNINYTIRYNYLDKTPYGILFKSGTDAGKNMTYTPGYGASYNIIKNAKISIRMKGINGVQVYNNTFYSSLKTGSLIFIDANNDRTTPAPSTGARIKNNIFYTVNKIYNIAIERSCLANFESDYNIFYCESGSPMFSVDGVPKTFDQWQAMGYDVHSIVLNPDFIDLSGFVPKKRLDYGINLGTGWISGLSTTAAWVAGRSPSTTNQNGTWQVGAIIYPALSDPGGNNPPPPEPVPENTPPVVVVNAPPQNISGFVAEFDASASHDPDNDQLSFTWVIPQNVSVSSTNGSKIKYLAPFVNSLSTIEFTLKVSDGKTVQSVKVPVDILPYKPELDIAEIIKIEASNYEPPHYPYNILDESLETRWSAEGDNQWLLMELKDFFIVEYVKIAFQEGQNSTSFFDVMGSADKKNWEPILTKSASCGFSGDFHVFDFPPSKTTLEFKYFKLIGHSNSVDSWNHISEFEVFGYIRHRPTSFDQLPVKIYPNPVSDELNIHIEDPAMNPDFIRIVNLTGTILLESKIEPGMTDLQIPVDFRQGIYILQIGTGDLTLYTLKFIVKI